MTNAKRKPWLPLLIVIGFAALGFVTTFAYYRVPALRSSGLVSFLVPVQVIVDPSFNYPFLDLDKEAANSAAPWNALVYAFVGLVVALVIKKIFRHRQPGRN